ncbi:MAG: PHP-associated domain-containing protein [Salinarchaeum sp.]
MQPPVRVDPHVKVLSDRVVHRAKQRGLDALVYAPHFVPLPVIKRRAARFSDDDFLVVPGREVFTGDWRHRKHVLAIGLSEPVPDFITLTAAMQAFDRQDATVLIPHPEFATVSCSAVDCRRYRRTIDAVEVYNPKYLRSHTRRAHRLVDTLDVTSFGSSYAHLPATVGDVWTTLNPSEAIDTPDDLVRALASAPRRVARRTDRCARIQALAERAHLAWENSWKKIDRVILSGSTATRPDQPIYEGRFDDNTVYSTEQGIIESIRTALQ